MKTKTQPWSRTYTQSRVARREWWSRPRREKGLAKDLIKIAGLLIVQQAQAGLQDIQRGQSLADTWSNRGEQIKRSLKRKATALAWMVGKNQAKRTAKNGYKRAAQCVRDIFSL